MVSNYSMYDDYAAVADGSLTLIAFTAKLKRICYSNGSNYSLWKIKRISFDQQNWIRKKKITQKNKAAAPTKIGKQYAKRKALDRRGRDRCAYHGMASKIFANILLSSKWIASALTFIPRNARRMEFFHNWPE